MSERTRVALALGSGGARGYAHIGAIDELQSRGYEIAGVAGSSMGALVGGLFAAGKLDEFADWARTLSQLDVIRLLDPSIAELGTIRAEKILDRIRDMLGDIEIEDLPIPFIAVATDLAAGRSVWYLRGPVDAAIRASIAIPGVIAPTVTTGRVIADGGILDPLPIVATTGFDADLTIGVSLSSDVVDLDDWAPMKETVSEPGAIEDFVERLRRGADQWTGPMSSVITRFGTRADEPADTEEVLPKLGRFEVMNRSLEVMQSALARFQRAGHPPDVLIEVPRTACRVLDFHRAEEMIEVGRESAAKALDRAGLTGVEKVDADDAV
ncbi:patatin-like phospholipase family protein [Antrihabitans sp. YC2-6]|uniref:patatin-like phospholipase family protein n=1 Tax=Antrihabitans sp. YC2-6 TaxID=2799498 RepID=UPI0018F3C9CB|nr:patatin-like phospholipase family protein [Antrihabitans sp. YC2-6]MBJ8348763.1 patatin-like phospholipase family protein [Antrihabitans sp. YC2-6]